MVAEGFVAPELNPMHRLKVGEEKVIEEVDGVFHVTMGRVMTFWPGSLWILPINRNNKYYDLAVNHFIINIRYCSVHFILVFSHIGIGGTFTHEHVLHYVSGLSV